MKRILIGLVAAALVAPLGAPAATAFAGGPYVAVGVATSDALGTFEATLRWPGQGFGGPLKGFGVATLELRDPSTDLLVHVNRAPTIEQANIAAYEPPCILVTPDYRLDSVVPHALALRGELRDDVCTGLSHDTFIGQYLFDAFALELRVG